MTSRKTSVNLAIIDLSTFVEYENGRLSIFDMRCHTGLNRNPVCKCSSGLSLLENSRKKGIYDIGCIDFNSNNNIYLFLIYDGHISCNLNLNDDFMALYKSIKSSGKTGYYYIAPIVFMGSSLCKNTVTLDIEMKHIVKSAGALNIHQIFNNVIDIHKLDKTNFYLIENNL